MTIAKSERYSRTALPHPGEREGQQVKTGRRAPRAIKLAARSAMTILNGVPGTVHVTHAGADGTASALRTLPDSTLRWLAVSSLGLGAGFYLAGAPRLVIAAAATPALFMGAAIVGRPIGPSFVTDLGQSRAIG